LALQGGIPTVRGEKRQTHDEEKDDYRMSKRRYGSFQRSLRLPETVDEDEVEASFNNGVLKVTPSASGARSRLVRLRHKVWSTASVPEDAHQSRRCSCLKREHLRWI
jgi:hypothetical protein